LSPRRAPAAGRGGGKRFRVSLGYLPGSSCLTRPLQSMSPGKTTDEREERLAEALDRLLESQRRGQSPDVEATAAAHPDLPVELRELWAAVQLADWVGSHGTDAFGPSLRELPAEKLPLPRMF